MATGKRVKSRKGKTLAQNRDTVRDQVLEALEFVDGSDFRLPWRQAGAPVNATTGRPYSGINVPLLALRAFSLGVSGGGWMTYKQARGIGGQVRGGEKSVAGVFYKQVKCKKEDAKQGEADTDYYSVMKTFRLFHTSQIDGLDPSKLVLPEVTAPPLEVIERPELEALRDGLVVPTRYGGDRACYSPSQDVISMPGLDQFSHTDAAWRTWLHEVVHATGHPSRLARTFGGAFGDEKYAFEELVAEFGSVILSSHFGLYADKEHDGSELEHLKSHAAYIKSWMRLLREDSSALFRAWRLASAAADWVQARGES